MESKTIGKRLITIGGVIFLGAVGSGAWQYLGDPTLTFIFNLLIDFLNTVSNSYLDEVYIKAAKGFHEDSSTSLYIFLVGGVPIFFLGAFMGYRGAGRFHQYEEAHSKHKVSRPKVRFALYAYLTFFLVFSISLAAQQYYINNVVTYVENTLDRLAPYESRQDILLLKAQFREVRSSEHYQVLYDKLESKLEKHELRSFSTNPL
ncbi:TPA: hypothetical protein NJ114_004491 [Vibrio parahaemolyticus]|nr:hypothetical protein [Vibrio parahaemolyticus]